MLRALCILIGGTLFFSCLLTPPVYSGLAMLLGEVPWPFSRVYDRVAMVAAAALLFLYRREFDLQAIWENLKAIPFSQAARRIGVGALISFSAAALVLPFVVGQGEFMWKEETSGYFLGKLLKVIPAALVISLIEEGFFRGILLQRLRKMLPFLSAAFFVSLLYAFVHFITPAKSFVYPGYSLSIGFVYLGAVFERLLLPGILPAMFGLFLVGFVLADVMRRTQSLYWCIGLHAGWVLVVKMAFYATEVVPGVEFAAGAGRRYFLVGEPLGWLSIVIVYVLMLLVLRKKAVRGGGDSE